MIGNQGMGGDFVTLRLGEQLFGLPVQRVHDVLKLGTLTRVPRAPSMVAGVMNLRGRIVTAIELRECLDLPPRGAGAKPMCVVVEQDGQPYALIVDSVGDVVSVAPERYEPNPSTMSARWSAVSGGIYRLDELMMVLDVGALLSAERAQAA